MSADHLSSQGLIGDMAETPSPQALEPKLEETEVAVSTDCPPSQEPVDDTTEILSPPALEPKLEETEVAMSTDCPPSQEPIFYMAETQTPQVLEPKLEETEVAMSTDCPPSQEPVDDTAETPSSQALEPKLEETEVIVLSDSPPSPEPVDDTAETPSSQALVPKLEETEVIVLSDSPPSPEPVDDTAETPSSQALVPKLEETEQAMSTDSPPSPEPVHGMAETPLPQALEPVLYEIEVELSSESEEERASNVRKLGTAKKEGSKKKKKHAGACKTRQQKRVLSDDQSTDDSESEEERPSKRHKLGTEKKQDPPKKKKHAGACKTSRQKRVLSDDQSTDDSESEEERLSNGQKLGTAKKQDSHKKKKHAGACKTSRQKRVLSDDQSTDDSESEEERPSKRQKLGTAKKQDSHKKKKHAEVCKTRQQKRVLSDDQSTDDSESEEERPSKRQKLGTEKKQDPPKKKKHAGECKTRRQKRVLSDDQSANSSESEEERPSKRHKLGTEKKHGSHKKKKHAGACKTSRQKRVLSDDQSTDDSESEEERLSNGQKLGTAKKQDSHKKKKHAGACKTSRQKRVLSGDQSTDNSESEEERLSNGQKLGTAKKQDSHKKVDQLSSQEPELQEESRSEKDHEDALEWEYQEDIECEIDAEDELSLKCRTRNSATQKAPQQPEQRPNKLSIPTNDIKWSSSPDVAQPYCPVTLRKVPGPTKLAVKQVSDIRSAFELFISKSIQKDFLTMTNLEGKRVYSKTWKDMDDIDMHAFYGVLILGSVYKSKSEKISSLWDSKTGRPLFNAAMSGSNFKKCLSTIRFDKWQKRCDGQQQKDKLTEIQPLWDKWVEQLSLMYNPGSNVTLDERLVGFRGKCPFMHYMPSKSQTKPYGIKFWTVCDATSSYAWNMQICTEKAKVEISERDQRIQVMRSMTQGLSGHNITCGGFFTSYDLGQELLKRNLTMVGPVLCNKTKLPPEFSTLKDRKAKSSEFLFTANTTLLSYVPRKGKDVILMSTLHREGQISDREDKKPQMVLHYNATKGGVDNLGKLLACYSCQRKARRWPLVVFYNMMDISAYNAFVIWLALNPDWEKRNSNKSWRLFLEELGKQLVFPRIQRRERISKAPAASMIVRKIQMEAAVILDAGCNPPLRTAKAGGLIRRRCQECPSSKDVKTNSTCTTCKRFICIKHRVMLCFGCVE